MDKTLQKDKFNYDKNNHPPLATSQEQFEKMRTAAKKEREEFLKRMQKKGNIT